MSRLRAVVVVLALFTAGAAFAQDVTVTPDVVYGHKYGMALTFDVFTPADANGAAVLNMVSGGWRSAWRPHAASQRRYQALLDAGFTVLAVRHGSSPKFILPEIVPDVRRAVRYVRLNARRLGIDANRLGVWGGSAGGHLSLMLGLASDAGTRPPKTRCSGPAIGWRRWWPTIRRSTCARSRAASTRRSGTPDSRR